MSHSSTLRPTPVGPKISDGDRLGLTFFLAASLHAIVILGVTFSLSPTTDDSSQTLDIILVQTSTPSETEDASFLAQVSQQGGGQNEENVRPQDLFTAPNLTDDPGMALQTAREQVNRKTSTRKQQLLLASTADFRFYSDELVDIDDEKYQRDMNNAQEAAKAARFAQEINTRIETASASGKVKYLNSSTREFTPARYMRSWINRVERIGNLNYPDQARRQQLSGTLILDVVVGADGKLMRTELRRSSGHKILDDAARRIVALAAPFDPFPEELRKESDIIHITRSWEFLSNNRLRTR